MRSETVRRAFVQGQLTNFTPFNNRNPSADMQDFSQLSSRTVTEVLMLEMKMAPAAKAYLVSGFPRSMRDVVEYQEKVSVSINPRES